MKLSQDDSVGSLSYFKVQHARQASLTNNYDGVGNPHLLPTYFSSFPCCSLSSSLVFSYNVPLYIHYVISITQYPRKPLVQEEIHEILSQMASGASS